MSTPIDERVVAMRFDNKQFEANVKTSMSTIEKLKQSLKFNGASKSFENISDSAKKVNISGLNKAVDTVKVKFSALEVMAVTALSNITNSAINAGKRIVSSLTIDPIKSGFREYETQINAVQTILANTSAKGTTLDQVNNALAELNTYADKTIYNFTEMTKNIGTFTAAGVGLNTSVAAIKGISNLAAVSGSNAQQASTAMYQLSQALASGTVKLQDWNSVVNAGMGGEVFQNALKETARVHGIAIDKMIKNEGSFRETLKKGWLTSEVLTETLNKFTGDLNKEQLKTMGYTEDQIASIIKMGQTANDAATKVKTFTQLFDTLKEAAQSGWTQSWQIIVGNFEEAKELLTNASTIFGKIISDAANARNNLLEGGLTSAWDRFSSIFNKGMGENGLNAYKESIKTVAKDHGIAIDKMISEEGSFEATLKKGWLTSGMMSESLTKLTTKLSGLSDAQLKSEGYTRDQANALKKFNEAIQNGSLSMDDFAEKIARPSGRENIIQALSNSFKALMSVIKPVKEAFNEIFPPMTAEQLYNMTVALREFTSHLILSDASMDNLKRTFKGLFAVLDIFTTLTGGALKIGLKAIASFFGVTSDNVLDMTASVGDAIVAFRDWLFKNNAIVQGLEKLGSVLKVGTGIVSKWIKNFMALPETQQKIMKFESSFGKIIKNLNAYFSGGIERIEEFVNRLKSIDTLTLDNVTNIIKDFKDNVVSYFLNVGGSFDDAKESIKSFKDGVANYFKGIGESSDGVKSKLSTVAEFIKDKFSGINLGSVLTVALGAGMIVFTKKIGDALELIAGFAIDFQKVFSGVSKVLNSTSKVLNSYATKVKAEALVKIAIAVGILAGSIALLTLLDQDKLWSAVGALGALAVGLVAVSAALGALSKVGGFSKASASILSISTSVLILSTALKKMEELDGTKVWGNVAILGAIAAGLSAFAIILGKTSPQLSKGSIFLLSFSASLKIIVSALSDLEGLNIDDINKSIPILIGVMSGLVILANVCKSVKFGSAASILAIAISLNLLIGSFKIISNLDTDKMRTNIEAFVAIFSMFAIIMASSQLAGKNSAKAGAAVIAMSASLLIIIHAFKMMADIDPLDLDRALKSVSQLLLVFAAVTAISKFAGENAVKAGAMLLLMSGAILILTGVMVVLSKLDPSGLGRALGAIAALEVVFGALIAVTKLAQDCKTTLVMLTITIGLLAVALGTLSMINPENLQTATVAISSVIAMFSLLVASTSLAKNSTITLVIMTAVVAALAGMLYLLSGLPVGSTLEIAASLSILLVSLSGACLILSAVGSVISAALLGIVALMALIGGVGAVIVGLGELVTYFPKLEQFLNKGLPVLEKIGYGLGVFFGNIIGGFTAGATSGLPKIGENLSSFMTAAQPFFNGVKSINSDAIYGVKALAETILVLTAADVLNGLTSWLTGGSSLTSFGKEISEFGDDFKDYADKVKGIDGAVVESSANAAKTLAEFASAIPNSGGWIAKIVGENSLSKFAKELAKFGPSFATYAESVKGINPEAVTASASAAKTLADMASALPNSGGVLAAWVGDNKLSTFAKELAKFGPSIKKYGDSVVGLKTEAIANSATAAKSISELANNLPNSGGVLAAWVGDNKLSTFAKELSKFGPSLKKYSDDISGLKTDVVINSTNAAKALSELAHNLPNSGGLTSWFSGDNNIKTFGKDLVVFGENFALYADKIKDIKPDVVSATTNAASAINQLSKSLPEKEGLFSKKSTLPNFGENISKFGGYLERYYTKIKDITPSVLSTITAEVSKLTNIAIQISGIDSSKISKFGSSLVELGKNGISGFINTFTSSTETITNTVNKTFVTSLESAVKTIRNYYDNFESAGAYIVEGLSIGINNNLHKVKSSGSNLGIAALNGTKEAIEMHSPPAKFIEIGEWMGKATSKGIDSVKGLVKKAGNGLGLSALDGTSESLISGAGNILGNTKKLGSDIGTSATDGVSKGIDTGSKKINTSTKKAAKSAYDIAKEWIDERKYYNQLSLTQELTKWKELQAKYKKGTDERKAIDREVYRVTNEISDDWFTKQKKLIDDEKTYKKLSTKAELTMWQDLQKNIKYHYKAGTKERVAAEEEANKNVKDLRIKFDKEISDKEDAADKKELEKIKKNYEAKTKAAEDWLNAQKKIMDDDQHYNNLTLDEELSKWKKIQKEIDSKYNLNSKEWVAAHAEASRKIYDLEKELAEKSYTNAKEWIDNEKYYNRLSLAEELYVWKELQKAYAEGSEKRIEADKEVYRIQKEIQAAEEQYNTDREAIEKEANEKRKSLEDDYYEKVKSTNEKLLSDIKTLNDAYDAAVKSRADSLYSSYGLFDSVAKSDEITGAKLTENLESQLVAFESWQKNINDLAEKGIADDLLDELQKMGPDSASKIEALNKMSSEELDKYVALWKTKHELAKKQAIFELEDMRIDTINKISKLNSDANTELTKYKDTWAKNLMDINVDTDEKLRVLRDNWISSIGTLTNDTIDKFKIFTDDIKYRTSELTTDFEDSIGASCKTIVSMFAKLVEDIKSTMTSPNWSFIGSTIGGGIINGIIGVTSGSNLGDLIGRSAEWIANNSGINPSSNRTVLNSSNNTIGLNTSGNLNVARAINVSMQQSQTNQNGSNLLSDGKSISFTQNNYSPKALSRTEIYRQTKNQFSAIERMVQA